MRPHGRIIEEIEWRCWRRPCGRLLNGFMAHALIKDSTGFNHGMHQFPGRLLQSPLLFAIKGGHFLEKIDESIKLTAEELEISQRSLEAAVNKIQAILQIVTPQLEEEIRSIRATRMSVETECRTLLSALSDVRDFFMGKNYESELQRIERMVALCKELRQLQQDGTLDAISDAILKLAGCNHT
jgi:hypothetical protein